MSTLEVKYYSFEQMLAEMGYIVYTNVGSSMLPLLRERRDIIEIQLCKERPKKYDVVLYKIGDKYILHRILEVRPNDYVICGDHNIKREYGITDDMILGVMTRVVRNGKPIYPTNWKYRIYVHLWCDFFPIRAAILYTKMRVRALKHTVKKHIFRKSISDRSEV